MAFRLLGWTHEQFRRHTPVEVEEQIEAAIWRIALQHDAMAWHVLQAGAKREGRIGLRDILGRAPLILDERSWVRPPSPYATAEGPSSEEMTLFDQAGIPGGMATQDEMDAMYADLESAWDRYESLHGPVTR